MCTDANLKDVLLDPPRSGKKRQAALALITGITSDHVFVLQMVQLVSEDEFPSAVDLIKKLQLLSRSAKYNETGQAADCFVLRPVVSDTLTWTCCGRAF